VSSPGGERGPSGPAAGQERKAPSSPTGERGPMPPHDAPTAAQLVEAVRELLEGDVMDATTGRVRYHVRVAINVLATVQRELELGPALAEGHAGRLAALGFGSDAELAAAIRAGELDDRWDEVAAAVRATVADKLAVAHPDYT
jgi:hypothetical protein